MRAGGSIGALTTGAGTTGAGGGGVGVAVGHLPYGAGGDPLAGTGCDGEEVESGGIQGLFRGRGAVAVGVVVATRMEGAGA
jgi:hypothetical protein